MIPEGTEASGITIELARQVWHDVETFISAHKISRKHIGRDIGYQPSVISETLAGTYRGDWRTVTRDMDAWLESEQRRREAPGASQFCWTAVAEEIRTVASVVRQLRSIGLVYGPDTAGIGKTMALRAIHQETPGSLLITVDRLEANPTGLLRAIARAAGISDGQANRAIYARLRELLRGTSRLLLVDQVHNLRRAKDDKPLYILCDLFDATGAPQLWAGTADMVQYLQMGTARGDQSLAQVRSRITYVRDLMARTRDQRDGGRGEPLLTIEQVREMFARNKLRLTPAAIRMLYELCLIPDSGALRTAVALVRIASLTAEQLDHKSIDAPLLQAALRDSVHAEVYDRLRHRLAAQADPARQRATA